MNIARFVIYLAIAFFLLYGVAFSIFPAKMAMLITQSQPDGGSPTIDFRATYGGLNIAIGLTLIYLYAIKHIRACLIITIIVLLSMAVTRSLGFVLDGSGNTLMMLFLVLEVLGSMLAFVALRRVND